VLQSSVSDLGAVELQSAEVRQFLKVHQSGIGYLRVNEFQFFELGQLCWFNVNWKAGVVD
jgi:hypothetical protein